MWIKTVNELDGSRNILYHLAGTGCNLELLLWTSKKQIEICMLSTVNGITNSIMRLLSDDPRITESVSLNDGTVLGFLTKVYRLIETKIDAVISDGVNLLDLEMIIDSALNSMVYGFRQENKKKGIEDK